MLILTHADDVTGYRVTEGEIAGNGNKDVDQSSDSYTCKHNASRSEVRVDANLVQDGKHLHDRSAENESLASAILRVS